MPRDPLSAIRSFNSSLDYASSGMENLLGSSSALVLALMESAYVMAESTEESARRLHSDIVFYRSLLGLKGDMPLLVNLPDSPESTGARASALSLFYVSKGGASVVASYDSLLAPAPEAEKLRDMNVSIASGDEVERDALELVLTDLGYIKSRMVTAPGQYSLRGFILDIFPSTSDSPVRVEFFGDEVEAVRTFDIESQRSVSELRSVMVPPAALDNDEGEAPLLDALKEMPLYATGSLALESHEFKVLSDMPISDSRDEGMSIAPISGFGGLGVLPEERGGGIQSLPAALGELAHDRPVMLVASSRAQAERLREMMREHDLICPIVDLAAASTYTGSPFICVGRLSAGLNIEGLLILTELEIFGGRPAYRSIKKSRVAGLLTSLDDLEAGDLVVHEDRGIGRFMGLAHQEVEGLGYDMILLEYAEGSRLHLPVSSIDRIRKYHAEEGVAPRLDSLSAKRWAKTRQRVKKRVVELAGKLLKLYAEREVTEGHAFGPDTDVHTEFDSFFPYEETPDQARAIDEIKRDMESPRPMDRLLCGDVGYGKTEVAMRAAFKSVYEGKQVAVLVPTTLLCEQHLRVFTKRFAAFPVSIAAMDRFKGRKANLETLGRLKRGEVDIVIATHSLLRGNMEFANLGLLVIDEEHRFGVGQKEKLKELGKGVDVLGMSATPIPRTLQMSLSGIRGMSLIETPPEERQAVRSSVAVFSDGLIRDAMAKELDRNGQVFFVHNRIKDIGKLEQKLTRLAPLARIAVAHGQMKEGELEKIMLEFLEGKVDVLLSTAIVGAGLDIPTANTIIVDMADKMGLADLYQLKGRVGRGEVRGHAWFLIGGEGMITEEARERLKALEDMSYMGAGFRLAMKDLEIRGAGNLLGPEQSGAIEAVGFDLYMEMLQEAVSHLRGTPEAMRTKTSINLKANAFVPEGYIEDMAIRLSMYRMISGAADLDALKNIEADVTDRFGRPPEEFMNLLKVRSIAIRAEALSIQEISLKGEMLRFVYADSAEISAEDIMAALTRKLRFVPGGFEVKVKEAALVTAARVMGELEGAAAEG